MKSLPEMGRSTIRGGSTTAMKIGIEHLKAYGDLKHIINQVRGEYEVQHEDLVPYHNATINIEENFQRFYTIMYLSNITHMQMC